tara:strand:- start:1078 stop:1269 length:192 start_codon:yes stop_codon:yes gene_type:complete
MEDEFLESVVIDVCAKTFLIESDQGDKKRVTCDTTKQFMDVLAVVTDQADPEIIKYADLSVND